MKSIVLLLVVFGVIECKTFNKTCVDTKISDCGPTVEVGAYIESLCPYCRDFVVKQLYPTFNKLYVETTSPIMTVNLVTFGNANLTISSNSTKNPTLNFTCQHKDQECDGNLLHSCSVMKFGIEKSLAFINCMYASPDWKSPWNSSVECSKQLNLNFTELSECANSLEGLAIEYFMAGQTLALQPPHKFVPWITINGIHTDDIQEKAQNNLLKLVCDTYQAEPKPDVCKSAYYDIGYMRTHYVSKNFNIN